ncbi:MAG: hypothetical protein WAW37_00475 [Syntrophobacteraceae bacterium]
MKKLIQLTLLIFVILNTMRADAVDSYTTFNHPLFTMSIPSTWHHLSKDQIKSMFIAEAKRQGVKLKPELIKFDYGFQKYPVTDELYFPTVTITIDANPKLFSALTLQLNSMTENEMKLTYAQAFKTLSSEMQAIIDVNLETITFNRNKKLLVISTKAGIAQTKGYIYIHKETLIHIVCSQSIASNAYDNIFSTIINSVKLK